jgi:hypothetical protein
MRACIGLGRGLLILVLGAAAAACGGDDEMTDGAATGGGDGSATGGTGGTGGGGGDAAGGSSAVAYKWLAIVDDVAQPACTGTGPGADIDSIEVKRAGTSLGVGLTGSASWVDAFPGGPTVVNCSMCGSGTCPHSGATVAARVEGKRDAMSYANMPDVGYIALNGGAVWVQLGSAMGAAPAQDIRTGDVVSVNEVDQLYVADMSANGACSCPPEKYSVYAYVEKGQVATRKKLTAMPYKSANAAMCGTFDAEKGCGSTDFTVP